MPNPDAESQAGFTLLETIVAFVILSIVLGAATLSISYSARLYQRADRIRAANQLAERLVAERFDTGLDQQGGEDGREGELGWHIRRREAAKSQTAGAKLMAFELMVLDRSGQALAHYQSFYMADAP